ncbi:hypothetical protein CGCVW01_v009842 [Colletotrichum viniferum]|nr:hypothetical protein CGCVW01_v009842 [Colletotrichum viniferum]
MQFSTQRRPILKALAHGEVLHAYAKWSVGEFMNPKHSADVHRGIATAFKVLVVRSSRLASKILMNRYRLPQSVDPERPLALYEKGILKEAVSQMALILDLSGSIRGTSYNDGVLPRCRAIIEAIGQRIAYEAAKAQGNVIAEVLNLFKASCIQESSSWFVEHSYSTRSMLWDNEKRAYGNLLPLLPSLVDRANTKAYITAPLVDKTYMKTFIKALPAFSASRDDIMAEQAPKSRL